MSACSACLSVCLSVTFVNCAKTNKDIFEIFTPSGSQAVLVFRCEMGWRYSDGNPLMGASNSGGVDKKRDSEQISGYTAYRSRALSTVPSVRVAKCEKYSCDGRQRASSTPRCLSSVVRTRRRLCDRLYVIHRRGGQLNHPPDTTPLVITPFSAAVVHHRTEPGRYFCWKLTLTHTPEPIRPTRWGPDPNRPTNGSKQGGLWPRGVCPVGVDLLSGV